LLLLFTVYLTAGSWSLLGKAGAIVLRQFQVSNTTDIRSIVHEVVL
jgi:hypothetical protein